MKHVRNRRKIIGIGLVMALLAVAGLAAVASAQGPTSPGYGWGYRYGGYGGMVNGWGYGYGGYSGMMNGWGSHRWDSDDMPGRYGDMRGGYGYSGYNGYGGMRGGYGYGGYSGYGGMRGGYGYGGMRGWGYR